MFSYVFASLLRVVKRLMDCCESLFDDLRSRSLSIAMCRKDSGTPEISSIDKKLEQVKIIINRFPLEASIIRMILCASKGFQLLLSGKNILCFCKRIIINCIFFLQEVESEYWKNSFFFWMLDWVLGAKLYSIIMNFVNNNKNKFNKIVLYMHLNGKFVENTAIRIFVIFFLALFLQSEEVRCIDVITQFYQISGVSSLQPPDIIFVKIMVVQILIGFIKINCLRLAHIAFLGPAVLPKESMQLCKSGSQDVIEQVFFCLFFFEIIRHFILFVSFLTSLVNVTRLYLIVFFKYE